MKVFSILIFVAFLSACSYRMDSDKKIVSKTDSLETLKAEKKDSTKKLIAALPFQLDSTEYIIHPIGYVHVSSARETRKILDYSSSSSSTSTESDLYVYSSGKGISGALTNIVFESMQTGAQTVLTQKRVLINEFYQFRIKKTKTFKIWLVYNVYDSDTNNDGRLDSEDIRSLYISNVDGTNFHRISPKKHDFIDDTRIGNKLYFRTLQDINKDNTINSKDQYHSYCIDMQKDTLKLKEYDILKLLK